MIKPNAARLKQRYAFEDWQSRNSSGENLYIWNVSLTGSEVPGWYAQRIGRQEATGWLPAVSAAAADSAPVAAQPPMVQSFWQPSAEGRQGLFLNADLFECASRADAHSFLLDLLSNFQSTTMSLREDASLGDVVFTDPQDTFVLSARANVVVLIRNAGRDIIPVIEFARQIDAHLSGKPEQADRVDSLVVPEFAAEATASDAPPGSELALPLRAARSGRSPMVKFFSRSGEVVAQGDRLVYQPSAAGEQEIEIYAVTPSHSATSQTLRFSR